MNLTGLDFPGDFPITPELKLPADADARRMAFVGMSGSGKTSSAKVIVEHLARAGRRVAVIDPNGIWHGLKTSADGAGAGLPFVVFGGRHADVPLEASAGVAVADLVMDEGLPVILDLSGFEVDADGLRVAGDFISRLRFRQSPDHEPILLVVDEADLIAPQTARKEELASQRALINTAKRSRADGLGLLVITQRPVGLATSILNQMEAVFLLRFAGYNDLDRVKEWLGTYLSPQQRDAALAALPSLSEGECFAVSPAWMKTFQRVQFPLPATFDSSATPKAGSARRTITARADVDLSALAARFTAAIKAERENDPDELKKRIDDLKGQLRDRPAGASAEKVVERGKSCREIVEVEKYLEVPVFREGEVDALSALADNMIALGKDLLAGGQELRAKVKPVPSSEKPSSEKPAVVPIPFALSPDPSLASVLSSAKQKILAALSEMESLGLAAPTRTHIAVFAGASPASSAYSKNLAEMNADGLVTYPRPSQLALTPIGRRQAPTSTRLLSRRMLHEAWTKRLPEPQKRLVQVLIDNYPAALTRTALASRAGASPTSSAYSKNLTELKDLGLIGYPRPGQVWATALLFPKGLPE